MIHYDYLVRMLEEFTSTLARVAKLREGALPVEAGRLVDGECRKLAGDDREALLRLSATELLARLARAGTALEMRHRALFLVALLREDGDLAAEAGEVGRGREAHLKALEVLLEVLATPGVGEYPAFAPTVEGLRACLEGEPLPPLLAARLMHHYERSGEYASAEDVLHALVEELSGGSGEAEARAFGVAFYRRLLACDDAALERGRLPRSEVESGLAALRA